MTRDIDELLASQCGVLEKYPKRDCDNCNEAKSVQVCHGCIERYLHGRQTLEDVRRM